MNNIKKNNKRLADIMPTDQSDNFVIFSGNANRELAFKISKLLNTKLGDMDVLQFSDGEVRAEINEHVRGKHVVLVQSTCAPANDNLMELMVMIDACKRSGSKMITAVVPYYGYSRQDRRPDYTRTPITSKLVADMLQVAGIDQIVIVDIHSTQQQGFFNVPVINISATPEIVGDIWRHNKHPKDIVVVSPDTGGVGRARMVAKQLDDAGLAIIDKRRPEANMSEVMNVIGNIENKHCIIVDDMIDTAGTLCKGAAALKEFGAASVVAYTSHPVFSGQAYENINNSKLDEVVVTDTIPLTGKDIPDKIRILSVAGLLAETIQRILLSQSISEIYTGG